VTEMLRATARTLFAASHRALAVVTCSLGLASCSSVAMPDLDAFKPKPTGALLIVESSPSSAEARASLGNTCHTPCSMLIGAANDFTVSFALDGYVPQTLTVHSAMSESVPMLTVPSPVLDPAYLFAKLEPARPQASPRNQPRQRPGPAAAGAQQ
jgi:hypothetical protein